MQAPLSYDQQLRSKMAPPLFMIKSLTYIKPKRLTRKINAAKNGKRCALFRKSFTCVLSQPKVSPDRPEPKHDQPLPRYKNPLGMDDTSHRLLALYHHVEPGYLASTTPSPFDLALWDYTPQVVSALFTVSTLSTHCPTAFQRPFPSPPSAYSFTSSRLVSFKTPCDLMISLHLLACFFTIVSSFSPVFAFPTSLFLRRHFPFPPRACLCSHGLALCDSRPPSPLAALRHYVVVAQPRTMDYSL